MHFMYSPFIIPLAGILVAIVAIIGGVVTGVQQQRLRAEQRLAMLHRGFSPAEIESAIRASAETEDDRRQTSPVRRLENLRRASIVLIATGLGLVVFFGALAAILQVKPVLCASAAGLIPLFIGLGFAVDYRMSRRDLARYGLELEADAPSGR